MKKQIEHSVTQAVEAIEQLASPEGVQFIETCARWLADCFERDKKVLIAGNGGSLCDASHFAEELTGFFRSHRRALPALALNDPGHLTCVANDVGFEHVFARAIEAHGLPGDLFIGLTTSGNSANIISAFKRAKELGLKTIAFLGKGGGKLKEVADLELCIEGFTSSDRIQEAHMTAIHIAIEMMERRLFDVS